jgi:hypothetical protein
MTGTGRDICWAISMMRKGGKVHRTSWQGSDELSLQRPAPQETTLPYIAIATPGQPAMAIWHCTSEDLLATDWELAGE